MKKCLNCNRNAKILFCDKCREKYLTRSSGTRLEGLDYTRERVRMRDKHKCSKCGKRWKYGERRFDIHHLRGCGQKSKSYDKKSELKNLITLCHSCHLGLESVKIKMKNHSSPRPQRLKTYMKNWRMRKRLGLMIIHLQ